MLALVGVVLPDSQRGCSGLDMRRQRRVLLVPCLDTKLGGKGVCRLLLSSAQLRHALQQLPPKDRALLALAQEGRSQVEMAEATGTSVMAVKARLHRAREKLRQFYQRPHET